MEGTCVFLFEGCHHLQRLLVVWQACLSSYIHYLPLGKYLKQETFVNVFGWLSRIDY